MIEPGSAAVLYYPFNSYTSPAAYQRYGCPIALREDVPVDALIVLPEIWPDMAHMFPNRCALWWLSVDNFGSHGQHNLDKISVHLSQSEYARRHVCDTLGAKPLMLTDWVEVAAVDVERVSRVVVNPAKDAGLLAPFIDIHQDVEFVELRGLDDAGVAELLWSSQVYMDFGRHPGRDRPPREAASAGCVVLCVALGAANVWDDMPLDSVYKFNTLNEASNMLWTVMSDWSYHYWKQEQYRRQISVQREVFFGEVLVLLDSVKVG
jgi:hypothetical protein